MKKETGFVRSLEGVQGWPPSTVNPRSFSASLSEVELLFKNSLLQQVPAPLFEVETEGSPCIKK